MMAGNAMLGMLGPIGAGLSLFGGVEGLIQGANAEHQAEVAAQNAIRDFKGSSDAQRLNLLTSGTAGLNTLSGGLNNALIGSGRSLGASLAGAGINDSTAAAGALTNQANHNASVEGQYSGGLASELLSQQNNAAEQSARMGYGLAVNNLNFAREQAGGAASGLGQFFGQLGQMNFGQSGGNRAGMPQTSSVLPQTNGIVAPVQNQFGAGGLSGGLGSGSNWGGF